MATKETEERTDQQQENAALTPTESSSIEAKNIVTPEGISEEEEQELRRRSEDLVKELKDASGSKEMELFDSITNLGVQTQRNAAAELDLLRTRVGDMLAQDGPGAQISKDLVDLRLVLDEINPHELSKPGFLRRVLSVIPFVGKLTPGLRILEKIAIRYEAVSKQELSRRSSVKGGCCLRGTMLS